LIFESCLVRVLDFKKATRANSNLRLKNNKQKTGKRTDRLLKNSTKAHD